MRVRLLSNRKKKPVMLNNPALALARERTKNDFQATRRYVAARGVLVDKILTTKTLEDIIDGTPKNKWLLVSPDGRVWESWFASDLALVAARESTFSNTFTEIKYETNCS